MKTVYARPLKYVECHLGELLRKKGYDLIELRLHSRLTKEDVVIFKDVNAYLTPRWFWKVLMMRREGIPMILRIEEPPAVVPYNHFRLFHLPRSSEEVLQRFKSVKPRHGWEPDQTAAWLARIGVCKAKVFLRV